MWVIVITSFVCVCVCVCHGCDFEDSLIFSFERSDLSLLNAALCYLGKFVSLNGRVPILGDFSLKIYPQ